MAKEKLHSYPVLIDPWLDFEATKEFVGRGSCIYNIKHFREKSGETIVYMLQQKESDELVFDKGEYIGKKCIQGIIVAGRLKGIFRNKIEIIPKTEKEQVKSKLSKKVKDFLYIDFW